jgi:hypothetical protein
MPRNLNRRSLFKIVRSPLLILHVLFITTREPIPAEIGMLSNLTRLKLNYNGFVGSGADLSDLSCLSLIHLQGNRLTGSIPPTNLNFLGKSSYITDCGNPSDFKASLGCEECTMCCKSPPSSVVISYCLLA